MGILLEFSKRGITMIESSDLKPGKLFRTKIDLVAWHLPTHNPIDKSVKIPCGDFLFPMEDSTQ